MSFEKFEKEFNRLIIGNARSMKHWFEQLLEKAALAEECAKIYPETNYLVAAMHQPGDILNVPRNKVEEYKKATPLVQMQNVSKYIFRVTHQLFDKIEITPTEAEKAIALTISTVGKAIGMDEKTAKNIFKEACAELAMHGPLLLDCDRCEHEALCFKAKRVSFDGCFVLEDIGKETSSVPEVIVEPSRDGAGAKKALVNFPDNPKDHARAMAVINRNIKNR